MNLSQALDALDQHQRAGGRTPELRTLAKKVGRDHALANQLWQGGSDYARLLAGLIADPRAVTPEEMDAWVTDIDSWYLCDGTCFDLWRYSPHAWSKCEDWSTRDEEFVKRSAFALMAGLAIKDHKASVAQFSALLPIIEREAGDARLYVRKAVNWALRQIGKRNRELNRVAIECARRITSSAIKSAHWVGRDALKELESAAAQARLV